MPGLIDCMRVNTLATRSTWIEDAFLVGFAKRIVAPARLADAGRPNM